MEGKNLRVRRNEGRMKEENNWLHIGKDDEIITPTVYEAYMKQINRNSQYKSATLLSGSGKMWL
jgi:hypothetical protein